MDIRREALPSAVADQLIAALNAELLALYPGPGANHFRLDPEEVSGPRGAFLLAVRDGSAIGCGAIRRIAADLAEIKRMYVAPAARGHGIGRQLVVALLAEAARLDDVRQVVLETGIRQQAAMALYRRMGFRTIPPYGEYTSSPDTSVCMALDLTTSGG